MRFLTPMHLIVTESLILTANFLSGALAMCTGSALFITAPRTMEALSGSCLQIPCAFRTEIEDQFDENQATYGVWLKTKTSFENIIFNSSRKVNPRPVAIVGNLTEKNCTSIFSDLTAEYTDFFYFRVENRPYMATDICNPLNITVNDTPPSPKITIQGRRRERSPVTVTCSAMAPCPKAPPELTLSPGDADSKLEQNPTNRLFMARAWQEILLSDRHNGLTVTCRAVYPVNDGEGRSKRAESAVTLIVEYSPKDTSAEVSPPAGLVSPGGTVNLTCSGRANPPVDTFTWFRRTADGPASVADGSFYSFNATGDGGVYYCVASNAVGNQTSTEIRLIIEGSERTTAFGIVRGIIVVIFLIGLAFCVWWIWAKHWAPSLIENQEAEQPDGQTEDGIVYAQINFGRSKPKESVGGAAVEQDTEYATVKAAGPARP